MVATELTIESLTVNITQEIHVKAPLDTTFQALLEQLGPENETPERPMPMKLEAWPGGRWFRDLGDGNGHFWAACKPSSAQACSKSPARYSCPTLWFRICNTA